MVSGEGTGLLWGLFSNHVTNFLFDCVSQFTDCDLQKFLEGASVFPNYSNRVPIIKAF